MSQPITSHGAPPFSPEPGYVTVGGIKWAKWNVGASTPEGYGDYYAWGAIYPQYDYTEENYMEGPIAANLTTARDVAYQKLGSNWRMPTRDEMAIFTRNRGELN